jgi:DNA replication protein DnaC
MELKDSNKPTVDIDSLLNRINGLVDQPQQAAVSPQAAKASARQKEAPLQVARRKEEFFPHAPTSLVESGITESMLEELIARYLFSKGEATGREIANQVRLPFQLIEKQLTRMKSDQTIGYIGQAAMNDYVCKLSDLGRERAKRYNEACTYFGAAPVRLNEYIAAVKTQSLSGQHPTEADLKRAFSDLLISPDMLGRLGPAVNSGKGMFLYGYPGNGKTSIAERVTSAFGKYIWVPRALNIDGEIMRLFDPMNHVEAPLDEADGYLKNSDIDHRWVRIERPTIVVGGELTMDHLEVAFNAQTGTSEAPIQMKSNCGTLVIDDFGRQRMGVDELLNRWIVPLEKRYDYLNTKGGKKIQVPFDQLVIFSTNLEPKDLVDDAFLRRIPYKIEVPNPAEHHFRELFEIMCRVTGFAYDADLIEYLIQTHYKPKNRPFRNCHPRDLLLQIKSYCDYNAKPMKLTQEGFDFAVSNYFSIMS